MHNTKTMRGEKMKVRVVCLKDHLFSPNIMLFLLTEEHETGANHIIECIHRFVTDKGRRDPLPKVLFVQADNCTRENKNRYMVAYLQMLVARGVFQETQLSFLPVGHTHEDINQVFSRTAERLRKHNAVALQKMAEELLLSYTPKPIVSRMKEVGNFSGLCDQEQVLHKFSNAWSHWRYFRFTVAEQGHVENELKTACHARVNCDDGWLPFNDRRRFLESVSNILKTLALLIRCLASVEERVRSVEYMRK